MDTNSPQKIWLSGEGLDWYGSVSFLYPVGFWSNHLVSGLIVSNTVSKLSKRPSKYSLIHFYKRCVSARPRILSLSFIQDQRRSTKQTNQSRGRKQLGLKNISSCFRRPAFKDLLSAGCRKRCNLLLQFLFSTLMPSDLIILCLY